MMRVLRMLAVAVVACCPLMARAQDARLSARLDAATRVAVDAILDSARAARLPVEPLVDKALEGASKHADGPRIVAAVRALAATMRDARAALGERASDGEIVAGASALRAGVSPDALRQLRRARSRESLTLTLSVLSELVARGVPADAASSSVVSLTAAGAGDADLAALRREVERDIAAGAPPATAISVATTAVVQTSLASSNALSAPGRSPGKRKP